MSRRFFYKEGAFLDDKSSRDVVRKLIESTDASFAETPEPVLASVAEIVEEVVFAPGETFINEGDLDSAMYIVLEGEVKVHSQNKTILKLGPGKSVGELAILDPEPRSANVTAVDQAKLFRISKESFDDVLEDRPEVARGVIRALCRRIRNQKQQSLQAASHTTDWVSTLEISGYSCNLKQDESGLVSKQDTCKKDHFPFKNDSITSMSFALLTGLEI